MVQCGKLFEITQDPSTVIIYRQHNLVIYFRIEDDRNWFVVGKCNESKGFCEKKREELDCPVTPEIECRCGLIGVYC